MGRIEVYGTADIPNFQFYKVEFASLEQPDKWNSIAPPHESAVAEAVLEVWDASALPDGEYILRLTVVDKTGNYPPPTEVRVSIEQPQASPSPTP